MIYNVAGLLTGNLGDSEQYEIENVSLEIDGHSLREINGPVRLMRTDQSVHVTAEIEAVTNGACSRCLEPATLNVVVNMEEEYSPANNDLVGKSGKSSNNVGSSDDDDYYDPALTITEQNYLDLTEGLGQALLGALPIAILCKEDCLGICPLCTVNRNIIQCSCAESSIDPRWAGLAGLTSKGAKFAD
jgi:uncharacterized protein